MRKRTIALAVALVLAAPAAAKAASGPHETIDNKLTTTLPNTAAGFHYTGSYHAAGNPSGDPPYMRRMVSYNPAGLRFDTTVPARCTASDLTLELEGPAACPAGSRIGGGTATSKFLGAFRATVAADVFNGPDEQVMVLHSPDVYTVARGRIHPDGSVDYASPTCFPALSPPGCPVDDVLQTGSSITVAPYTRRIGGVTRSYLTTPATCPASDNWPDPVRFWWADGSVDTVVIHEPCTQPAASARPRRARCAAEPRVHRYPTEPAPGCHARLARR